MFGKSMLGRGQIASSEGVKSNEMGQEALFIKGRHLMKRSRKNLLGFFL